jgi:hypothetical protein
MSETISGKILSIQADGTWEGKYGMMYKFEVTLEQVETGKQYSGEYSSKKHTDHEAADFPFKIGEVKEVEYQDGQFPKIKLPYNRNGEGGRSGYSNNSKDPKVQGYIIRQSSLQRAMEYYTHHKQEFSPQDVKTLAEDFSKWVQE